MVIVTRIIRLFFAKRKWRELNPHNNTSLSINTDMSKISVGNYTYGPIKVLNNGGESKLKVGHFCSIAGDVTFILCSDHPTNTVSTFPFKVMCLQSQANEAISKGDIIVDDDVWIGYGATILSGVHIHQGAIVAAGSVVTKDVPPYAIIGGVPAKVIKYRFPQEIVEKLLKVDYSQLDREAVNKNIDYLYQRINDANQFAWMPRKIKNS